MYKITFKKSAAKGLCKMPAKQRRQLRESLEQLAQDPQRVDLDTRKLQSRPGYRLRVGRWRAIYKIVDDELVILVLDIGPRGDIYK
ncbi:MULTISPECIES: type II toxin-antitoxin system RelE family toxin [Chromohalobacter]|uniref:Type II toxin-antitoxin system RelE/ParE family toxin n=1 Tax=Chromohalobacter sarecensis TaxID=245294 RepID=A0ABV9D4W2_9GAMM|nr:type II toxin-antitoxin system RelE/ParE family toxin [Chromohalobacter nigrandesensis]MCK0743701.1 type II toxin-antitoxin system RelE/ParE family toxin [Chromohalobacter nigrandesensis]